MNESTGVKEEDAATSPSSTQKPGAPRDAASIQERPIQDQKGEAPASGLSSAEHLACALHEVSNALTVVLGWLDVAQSSSSTEEVQTAIGVARQHARRGQVMARQTIGAEVESVHLEQTAAELAEFAGTSIQPQARGRDVRITIQCGPDTDLRLNSPDRVLQILTNLLMNGLSFSPEGGTITLSVEREGERLSFFVQDEGPGIDASRHTTLFSAPTSTRSGGLGLGLPHSRYLAQEAGGDLRLVPSESGARFELVWPLSSSVGAQSDPPASSQAALANARVLVVEDDTAISGLVELSFAARGAEVIVVANAEEFVNVLAGRPVLDLVLLDLSPVDDSLGDALDSLEAVAPGAPIILMSGQPTGIPPEAEGRFASWVRKPFDMEELVDAASRLLHSSSSAPATTNA